jgi:hypothetical protein
MEQTKACIRAYAAFMPSRTPVVGDVIVHTTSDAAGAVAYGVSVHEGLTQFLTETSSEAAGYADAFARRTRVDVWNENDAQFASVSRFRRS